MPLRLFKLGLTFFLSFNLQIQVKAQSAAPASEIVVFDIRRPLSLDPGKRHEKDYFINSGSEAGLKPDMLIVVSRRQTLYDAYKNKSPGELIVPVAELRIIHVQKGLSVARLERMVDRAALPNLDFDAVMVGDKLDMETARMARQKTAQIEEQPEPKPEPSGQGDFSSLLPTGKVEIPVQTL